MIIKITKVVLSRHKFQVQSVKKRWEIREDLATM